MASKEAQDVPALSLDTLKTHYPNIFQQYLRLSDREKEIAERISNEATVNENELCTTIMFVNFLEPLHENGIPEHLSEGSYQFFMFLWKLLSACESGSIGGEACRMHFVLYAALNDIMDLEDYVAKLEHMLAWTMAAGKHGLYQVLYRGEPETTQALFKEAGDVWKKLFRKEDPRVSDETIQFAQDWCKSFHKLLVGAKEEYGDYADYKFVYN